MLTFFFTPRSSALLPQALHIYARRRQILEELNETNSEKGFCVSMKFMVSLCPTVNSRKHFWLEIFCSVKLSFRHTLHVFLRITPKSFNKSTKYQIQKGVIFLWGSRGEKNKPVI